MKRFVILGVLYVLCLAGLGVLLGTYVQNKRSLVTYSVTIPAGSVVTMYQDTGGDGPFNYDLKKPIKKLNNSQTMTIKHGIYNFVIDNSSGKFAEDITQVIVNSATSNVNIKPAASDEQLAKITVAERPAITASFNKELSGYTRYYSVDKVAVFGDGEWAGVTLQPNSNQYDPARIVASKVSGKWKVVSRPSILVVGSMYVNVPEDVVVSINKL